MSNFRKKTARIQAKFYIRILQVLGLCGAGFLVSCVKNHDEPVALYGVVPPEGYLRFHGTIKSEDSLKSIPGLTVRLVKYDGWDSLQTITGPQGQYELFDNSAEGDMLKLKILDTDSTANVGDFIDQSLNIKVVSRDINNHERQVDVLLKKK